MIAFEVAWDKLAQFQEADEIAEFFVGEGIKAEKCNAETCALSKWVQKTTGDTRLITNMEFIGYYKAETDFTPVNLHSHTPAMVDFVNNFDRGHYPQLEDEDTICRGSCCQEDPGW